MNRTSAPNSVAGAFVDENPGTSTVGTTLVAADLNNYQEEICHVIERLEVALSGSDKYQLTKAVIGLSHQVGELVMLETEETPSEYFPAIPRNVNQDITAAMYPLLVAKLRAVKTKINGVTDHSVTVSGSVVTFPNTTEANKLLTLLQADAVVSGWHNGGEIANFLGGADFTTAATQRCLTIAGTEYAISGANAINLVNRTVNVSGTPASGAQTCSVYAYRIAGATTSARLFKIAGFAPVVAGDAGIEVVGGYRRMDRGQGHGHEAGSFGGSGSTSTFSLYNGAASTWARNASDASYPTIRNPTTDGTNGTPRTGKTTDPRTAGMFFYTWAGVKAA